MIDLGHGGTHLLDAGELFTRSNGDFVHYLTDVLDGGNGIA